jgi:hypothetical protein
MVKGHQRESIRFPPIDTLFSLALGLLAPCMAHRDQAHNKREVYMEVVNIPNKKNS